MKKEGEIEYKKRSNRTGRQTSKEEKRRKKNLFLFESRSLSSLPIFNPFSAQFLENNIKWYKIV